MSLLLLWSARAAATILVGLLLALALRRRSAAVRSVALRATLLAAWALPFAALVAPRLEVVLPLATSISKPLSLPEERTENEGAGTGSGGAAPTPGLDPSPVPAQTPSPLPGEQPPRMPDSPTPFSLLPALEVAYGTLVLALVLRWLVAFARLRRIAAAATPIDPGVALTPDLGVPATFGLLRPRILLPESSKAWPPARVRAAILHERAHVRRRDWAWQTLAGLFAALHWANPFAWLLARALRDAAEAAADDEVLAQMGPSEYARELLAVAETARPVGPALAMARRGGVRDRVVAILAANRDRRRPTLATGGLLLLIVLAASLAVAGVRRGTRQAWAKTLASGARIEIESIAGPGADGRLARWTRAGKPLALGKTNFESMRDARRELRTNLLTFRYAGAGPTPTFNLQVRSPSVSLGSIVDPKTKTIQAYVSTPKPIADTDVHLDFADGPWLPYEGPPLVKGPAPAMSPYLKQVGNGLSVKIPPELRSQATDLRVYVKGHREPFTGFMTSPAGDLKTVAFRGRSEDVERIELWRRPYRRLEFKNVRLLPPDAKEAQTPFGPFRLADRRAVQLYALIEDDGPVHRVWGPDGSHGWDAWGGSAPPSTPKRRSLSLWFRVWGAPLVQPEIDASIVGGSPWESGRYRGATEGATAIERILDTHLWVERGRPLANLEVDLRFGPWRTEVDLPVGKGKAEIDPFVDQLGGQPFRYCHVRLPGAPARLDPDRLVELVPYDREGRRVPTMPGSRPGPQEGRYFVAVEHPESVARLVLRTRAHQTIRLKNVRLAPR